MQLSNIKRLVKEDFPQSEQDTVDRLAYILNPFLDQISSILNKNIAIDNLSREFKTITVTNTNGILSQPVNIKTALTGKIVGISVISATNNTSSGTAPTAAPWLTWSTNGNIIS